MKQDVLKSIKTRLLSRSAYHSAACRSLLFPDSQRTGGAWPQRVAHQDPRLGSALPAWFETESFPEDLSFRGFSEHALALSSLLLFSSCPVPFLASLTRAGREEAFWVCGSISALAGEDAGCRQVCADADQHQLLCFASSKVTSRVARGHPSELCHGSISCWQQGPCLGLLSWEAKDHNGVWMG